MYQERLSIDQSIYSPKYIQGCASNCQLYDNVHLQIPRFRRTNSRSIKDPLKNEGWGERERTDARVKFEGKRNGRRRSKRACRAKVTHKYQLVPRWRFHGPFDTVARGLSLGVQKAGTSGGELAASSSLSLSLSLPFSASLDPEIGCCPASLSLGSARSA